VTDAAIAAAPRVSVVIPAYNRARLIRQAILSVLAQTFTDFELIVVDDGSTDGTGAEVASFQDPRVRLVTLAKRSGQSGARNAGIAESRGEWIAFLDSDDEWLPEKLARQMARVDQGPADYGAVYCACYRQHAGEAPELRPKGELPEGDLFDALLRGKKAPTPSVYVVKRAALIAAKGFDERMIAASDIDMWLRLARASCLFAAVQEPLAIKHDYGSGQIKQDAMAKLAGFRGMDRRWGPVMRRRLGEKAYQKWRDKRLRSIAKKQGANIEELVARGARAEALRYAVRLLPALPWARRYVARAIGFALFGRAFYGRLAATSPGTATLTTRDQG